ncbi:MAG: alpha/beta fold hydrolase [Lutimonas sp.]
MKLLHGNVLGKGEPLIILHGLFGMGDNWKSLANKYAEYFEVHLIDQRNHGRSFHSDEFSYEFMAEDLRRYIAFHELNEVNLLGHSMGGKTAMLYSTQDEVVVKKLIVADISPRYYAPHHQIIINALQAVDFSEIEQRTEVEDVIKAYISNFGIRQFLLKNVNRKEDGTYEFRFNLKSIVAHIEEVGKPLAEENVYHKPTLFIRGENSDYITLEDEILIKHHFPKAEIVTVKNAGHWLHAENPSDFYELTLNYLRN